MRTAAIFAAASSIAIASANCPAPGSTDGQGRYSCNPAHTYPSGQACKELDGCLFLVGTDGKPIISASTSTSAAAKPSTTCAAPGAYDAQSRYSCNPAHTYPNGQTCKVVDGCPLLVGSDGKPIIQTASSASASASASPSCAAPGTNDSKGRYSCNPAHQYPGGQKCQIIDGCPLLCGSDGKPVINTVTASSVKPTATANDCAAPGGYDKKGRYSCNLGHQYPNGQKCVVIDGCPLLCGGDSKPIICNTCAPAQPTTTPYCASPGAYDAQGRYSCNPAHTYPNGQKCVTIDGCPLLVGPDSKPIVSSGGSIGTGAPVKPTPTGVVTAGASALQAGAIIAVAAFVAAL